MASSDPDTAFDVLDPPELRDLLSRLAKRYAVNGSDQAANPHAGQ